MSWLSAAASGLNDLPNGQFFVCDLYCVKILAGSSRFTDLEVAQPAPASFSSAHIGMRSLHWVFLGNLQRGPWRLEPCTILADIDIVDDTPPLYTVWCVCPSKNDTSQLYTGNGRSSSAILVSSVEWRTVSNALEKSKEMKATNGLVCSMLVKAFTFRGLCHLTL